MEAKPTHEQAQLHLQVYDMRREAKLREARDWFFKNYFADSMDEAMRIAAPGTETGIRHDGVRVLGSSLCTAQLRTAPRRSVL